MALNTEDYELVVGLEVHIQLLTKSKAYSGDSTLYGEEPNTLVSVVSLGHPGALPYFNEKVLEYAIMLGHALHCDIRKVNEFARKNYFYADLPKGYQITQHLTPICTHGFVMIKNGTEDYKRINLTRIHMEEDAGKSMHDQDMYDTLVDYNRCGIPLLEIVSEPDMRSSKEAFDYLNEIRKLVRYLEICDGNMEEGSMRCDANISVRKRGETKLGVKVEVKNMNSMRNVQRAIDYEFLRQIEAIENGEIIISETRNFEATKGATYSMRMKELANDYRYFPEPDLPPVVLSDEFLAEIRAKVPALPLELLNKYVQEFGLSAYDAGLLTEDKYFANYFNKLVTFTPNFKAAANWMNGPIKSYLNAEAKHINDFQILPETISDIIKLIDDGIVNFTTASQTLFPELVLNPTENPTSIVSRLNIAQDSNNDALEAIIDSVLASMPAKVEEYRNGKKGLLGLFMGDIMKQTKGKAEPKTINQLLIQKLDA